MTAIYIPDEQQMLRAGQRLADSLSPWLGSCSEIEVAGDAPIGSEGGAIIFLHGQLGAGKTTLVRGLLRALGVEGAVRSPTYTLIEPYDIKTDLGLKRVFHLDLYRLADPEELDYLGWQELLGGGGLLLIEWPERGAELLPSPDLRIELVMQSPGRALSLNGRGPWREVAAAAARVLAATGS
jgi:tRNA threonylcarbamoyladenosine biosynthesis protein TsaE